MRGRAREPRAAAIAIAARGAEALREAAASLRAKGAEVLTVAADLAEPDAARRVVEAVVARFGRLEILVNNAGAIRGGDFLTTPAEQWADDWRLKILGYVRMAQAAIPAMRPGRWGRIVNIIGAAARNPATTYMAGGIANAGLINFTRALADLGRSGRDPRERGEPRGDRDRAVGPPGRPAGPGPGAVRGGASRRGGAEAAARAHRAARGRRGRGRCSSPPSGRASSRGPRSRSTAGASRGVYL